MTQIACMYCSEILHKTANETAITHFLQPWSDKNCNMQMNGQFHAFPIPHLSTITMLILYW